MDFYNNIKWILGIMMVFFIVLATNLIDRQNFAQIRESVVAIYEDRLIANDLLFKMAEIIHKKELAVLSNDHEFFSDANEVLNQEFADLILRYEQTKLTTSETRNFELLKKNIALLAEEEVPSTASRMKENESLLALTAKIKQNLTDLSKIQIEQGQWQMQKSKRAMDSIELFTQFEIYILIFLAICVQILVIYKPKA